MDIVRFILMLAAIGALVYYGGQFYGRLAGKV
jgi:hypothetical protein